MVPNDRTSPGRTGRIALGALCIGLLASAPPPRPAPPRSAHGLAPHDRTRLVELKVAGTTDAPVLIAAAAGMTEIAARAVGDAGGFVVYRADEVGYLRAVVLTGSIEALAALPAVESLNIDTGQFYFSSQQDPRPSIGSSGSPDSPPGASVPPPGPDTPAENGYLASKDLGGPAFLRSPPTFDGRGVTIGVIECCPDSLHPALSSARDASGRSVPKIARILTAGDFDKLGWNLPMRDEIAVHGPRFLYRGSIYTAPRDGHFRIGAKSADDNNLYFAPRHPPPITVLWDVESGTFWIDTNNDHSFADETPIHDFNQTGEAVALRWDEEIEKANYLVGSLAVLIDKSSGGILVATSGMHATAVSGGAAGHSLYGGAASGMAPGARILPVWTGQTTGGVIEAFLAAARQPDVDVISSSNAYEMRMRDGHSVWSLVLDRLVATYSKLIFAAAGNNGPGVATGNEAAAGSELVKIGGYVGRETWWTNFGLVGNREGYVGFSSTRGPRADGGQLVQMIAPICAVMPAGIGSKHVDNDGFWSGKALYTNPPGYEANCGTSFAAPMAAGSAAALISAARASGIPADPDRLRWAMLAGARRVPGFQAYEQGDGLIDLAAAWERLRTAPTPVKIRSSAPVRTTTSAFLSTPDRGTGLYEREGWTAGEFGERTITLTRTSGPREAISYALSWAESDGTFSSPNRVSLPFSQPVEVRVKISPRTAGVHSSLLRVSNADGVTPTHEMLATVIAAERLTPANRFSISRDTRVPWLESSSTFVEVPRGAGNLDVRVKVADGPVRLLMFDPAGERFPAAFSELFIPPDIVRGQTSWMNSGELRRSIPLPEAGVWEIVIEHNGYSRFAERFVRQKDAQVTVTAQANAVRSNDEAGSPCPSGKSSCPLRIGNAFAAFEGHAAAVGIASVARDTLVLTAADHFAERKIQVAAGATRLTVRMRSAEPAAAVDLHLFDCTQGSCRRRESVVTPGSEKELVVLNPKAGEWRAVVDALSLPAGSVSVEYGDAVVHPRFGELRVTDEAALHANGASWTAAVRAATAEPVPENHSAAAIVDVVEEGSQTPVGPFWGQPGEDVHLGPIVLKTFWLPIVASDAAANPRPDPKP